MRAATLITFIIVLFTSSIASATSVGEAVQILGKATTAVQAICPPDRAKPGQPPNPQTYACTQNFTFLGVPLGLALGRYRTRLVNECVFELQSGRGFGPACDKLYDRRKTYVNEKKFEALPLPPALEQLYRSTRDTYEALARQYRR